MNKLEEEIKALILASYEKGYYEPDLDVASKSIAELALKYIEKAYDAGLQRTRLHQGQKKTKEQWLKDNIGE